MVEIAPVLRQFTGENFYSSADTALCEAVLNAIDAIGRRQEREPAIEPQIDIVFDRTNRMVTLADNSDEMNRDDVARLAEQHNAEAHGAS
jgi:HSP90 family molecular chaperone